MLTSQVIDWVLVQQHLHFTLQTLQGACVGALWQPVFNVLARHFCQRCKGHVFEQLAFGAPNQRALIRKMQAIFFKIRFDSGQQLLGFFCAELHFCRIQQQDFVHADLPVAGGDQGFIAPNRVLVPKAWHIFMGQKWGCAFARQVGFCNA